MEILLKLRLIGQKVIIFFNSRLYPIFLIIKRRVSGTSADEEYWSKRERTNISDRGDWNDKISKDWIEGYWNSQSHPHRILLVDAIKKYDPSTILEIGCNCGPNLFLLAKKYPNARIVGIDINKDAVDQGNDFFLEMGIKNVILMVGKADNLGMFDDGQFDVVFTDAVLIYIGPDKIMKVIKEIIRITKKSSILLEWHDEKFDGKGRFYGHWIRNYIDLILTINPNKKIQIKQLTKEDWPDNNWIKFGYIVEIV